VKLAYADPPYPGQAKAKYADHPDYGGEVDHAELIARLEDEYDGWVLHTSEQALPEILALCPPKEPGVKGRRYRSFTGVRVVIWTKGGAPFPNEGMHAFEPIIIRGARPPARDLRDWFYCDVEYFQWRPRPPNYVTGMKPEPVVEWALRWLAADPAQDTLDDLFYGSGRVGDVWSRFSVQTQMPMPADRELAQLEIIDDSIPPSPRTERLREQLA